MAVSGKIVLKNGHVLKGDIDKLPDGNCRIILKEGAIEFEKDEIRKIIILSRRDVVHERFSYAFKMTPKEQHAAVVRHTPYENVINQEARKNNIDPALVKAVIKAESNFKAEDRSQKGACGLMQLMPETAAMLGVKSIFSPQENIRAGTRFLRDMLYQFNGDVDKALAAYNAGPGTVKRYNNGIPPYRETREYIKNVNRHYRKFKNPGEICAYTDDSGCLNIYNVK
jgi:hypothetical protein